MNKALQRSKKIRYVIMKIPLNSSMLTWLTRSPGFSFAAARLSIYLAKKSTVWSWAWHPCSRYNVTTSKNGSQPVPDNGHELSANKLNSNIQDSQTQTMVPCESLYRQSFVPRGIPLCLCDSWMPCYPVPLHPASHPALARASFFVRLRPRRTKQKAHDHCWWYGYG